MSFSRELATFFTQGPPIGEGKRMKYNYMCNRETLTGQRCSSMKNSFSVQATAGFQCRLKPDLDKRWKAGVESTHLKIGGKNACALKTSGETRKKETSHALNCDTSTKRIERNVKTENTQQVKIVLKLPKTVYGVPVMVTSPLLLFLFSEKEAERVQEGKRSNYRERC
jgi:hypothetical protein